MTWLPWLQRQAAEAPEHGLPDQLARREIASIRRRPALALGLVIVGCLGRLTFANAAVASRNYYVSPQGNDGWSGTLPSPNRLQTDGPFATLARARDAIRARRALPAGQAQGEQPVEDVTVFVRGGTYHLTAPVEFGPEDSGVPLHPIRYVAYPGETPLLVGGEPIRDTAQERWMRHRGHIWKHTVAIDPTAPSLRHLLFRDRTQPLARYPNENRKDPLRGGWAITSPVGIQKTFIQWMCRTDDWVEYQVDVPASGTYHLWVRYSGRPGLLRVALRVDGAGPYPVQELATTANQPWAVSPRLASVPLSAGRHVLRFTALAPHAGFHADRWILSDDADLVPDDAGSTAHVVTLEAEKFLKKETQLAWTTDTLQIGENPPPPAFTNVFAMPVLHEAWTTAPDPEIVVFTPEGADWLTLVLPISIDRDTGQVHLRRPTLAPLSIGRRAYIRNVLEELDAPGEWYVDRTAGMLYFWPPEGDRPPDRTVVLARLETLIDVHGGKEPGQYAGHLTFSGLTFRGATASGLDPTEVTASGAVHFRNAEDCTLVACHISDVAANAVVIDSTSRRITVEGCEISSLGAGGIVVPPPAYPPTAAAPKTQTGHRLAENEIHHVGLIHKGAAPIEIWHLGGNLVEHNYLHDLPRGAVLLPYITAPGNVIRDNEIRNSCLETADCGAIHTSTLLSTPAGGEISRNLIVNTVGTITLWDGRFLSPVYAFGIYIDDNDGNYLIDRNAVIHSAWGAFQINAGGGNLIYNNLFREGGRAQASISFKGSANEIVGNIFDYGKSTGSLYSLWNFGSMTPASIRFDSNLVAPRGRNITMEGTERSWADWRAIGFDVHSQIGDPLFVDAEHENFGLPAKSMALPLGFVPIDLSGVGRRGSSGR